jgi:hypothetical protein
MGSRKAAKFHGAQKVVQGRYRMEYGAIGRKGKNRVFKTTVGIV